MNPLDAVADILYSPEENAHFLALAGLCYGAGIIFTTFALWIMGRKETA